MSAVASQNGHDVRTAVQRLNDAQVRVALKHLARCVYCGNRTKRQAVPACHRHRKLVALDPYYSEPEAA